MAAFSALMPRCVLPRLPGRLARPRDARLHTVLWRAPGRMGVLLALSQLLWACSPSAPRGYECIAPAAAGGGWDLTCRLVAHPRALSY